MKHVIVCGGRDYWNKELVWSTLDSLLAERGLFVVVNGGASGADYQARSWARSKGFVHHRTFVADWKAHGRAAGPIRNRQMIDETNPVLVVAFPGGNGTADMVGKARAAGIRVLEVASAYERPRRH